MKKIAYIILILSVLSCGSPVTRMSLYPKMYDEKPLTLLVMPPVNNTSNVEAKELLYTSINKPLAEAGYYVISPHLAMDILKSESAYDSEMFINSPLDKFAKYFGADAVIFSQIDSWAKKGFGIETEIRYLIFDRSCNLYLDLSQNSNSSSIIGIMIDLVSSAITTAVTDHIVAARKANYFIFRDIPRGKYSPQFGIDGKMEAQKKDITYKVK